MADKTAVAAAAVAGAAAMMADTVVINTHNSSNSRTANHLWAVPLRVCRRCLLRCLRLGLPLLQLEVIRLLTHTQPTVATRTTLHCGMPLLPSKDKLAVNHLRRSENSLLARAAGVIVCLPLTMTWT